MSSDLKSDFATSLLCVCADMEPHTLMRIQPMIDEVLRTSATVNAVQSLGIDTTEMEAKVLTVIRMIDTIIHEDAEEVETVNDETIAELRRNEFYVV